MSIKTVIWVKRAADFVDAQNDVAAVRDHGLVFCARPARGDSGRIDRAGRWRHATDR